MISTTRPRKTLPSRAQSAWATIAIGHIVVIGTILLAWQGLYAAAGEEKLSSPIQTVQALVTNLAAWTPDLVSTLTVLAIALSVTAVLGVSLGFFIGLSAFWTDVFRPALTVIYSIPKIAIYPIFLVIFKISYTTLVLFAVFHGIIPIMIMVMEGVRSIPAIQMKLAQVYKLSLWQTFVHVLLPSLAPVIAEAVRMGASLTFLGLIIAEMFGSTRGLGNRLVAYLRLHQVDNIISVFILISAVGIILSVILLAWQRSAQSKVSERETSGAF
jgi:ABC-type nitrate/sulfonate/bicarbonate transport system permease component